MAGKRAEAARSAQLIAHSLLVILALTMGAGSVYAEGNAFSKLNRGLVNLLTGWLEVPARLAEGQLRSGFEKGLERTLYGLWDLVSFPFSPYDRPGMDPETLVRNH